MMKKVRKIELSNIILVFVYGLSILVIIIFGLYSYKNKYSFFIELEEISISLGESYQLDIIADNNAIDNKYIYKINDDSIVSISEQGYITTNKVGVAEIEVSSKRSLSKEKLVVNVLENAIETITFNGDIKLKKEETAKCYPIINGDTSIVAELSYRSEDESIAIVDKDGNITAISKGRTNIIASASNGISGSISVIVDNGTIEATSLALEPSEVTLNVGDSKSLTAKIFPDNTTNRGLTWLSSNSSIVSVNQNGVITARKKGVTTIIVKTANGLSKTSKITVKEAKVEATGLTLNSTQISLKAGDTYQLGTNVTPSNATDKNISWESSNSSVATVGSNGVVTAIGSGNAVITAKLSNGISANCNVSVYIENIDPVSVELSQTSTVLDVGNNTTLVATVLPSNATNKTVSWKSSDTSIVEVNQNGVIKAKKSGKATITVTTSNGKTKECVVTVPAQKVLANSIVLNKKEITIDVGKSEELKTTISPSNTTDKNIIWTSSNTSVATVNVNGVVTGKKAGTATITAKTSNGKTATCNVTVKNPIIYATGISINKTSLTLDTNKTSTLTATISPSNTTDKSVTWTSSNTSVATVNSSGVVTGKKAGTATITAKTSNGKTATCVVTVKNVTFTNPILNNVADPWVTQKDGYYYFVSTNNSKNIVITKTADLTKIKDGTKKTVYTGNNIIWAPELHYINGYWYIYYCDSNSINDYYFERRMYVLKSKTSDPMGQYDYIGKISDPSDRYALDGTVLQWNNQLYFIWSGREYDGAPQNIYIAHMSDPMHIDSAKYLISTPTYYWEKYGDAINEGPQVLIHNGVLHIIYSASFAKEDYHLGMLTYNGGDILSQSSWTKNSTPLFKSGNGVYGPGHASFVKSPDGTEDWIVYHAYASTGLDWSLRDLRIQKFTWNGNTPVFGSPVATGTSIVVPSGTK